MRLVPVCAVALLVAVPASAVDTQPKLGYYDLPGTTLAKEPDLYGVVQRDDLLPFTVSAAKDGEPTVGTIAHGTVQVRVVKEKSGTLDFYWKVNNAADSKDVIDRLEILAFPGHSYNVNWRIDGLGTAAPDQLLIANPYQDGSSQYEFIFNKQPIAPGQSSRFMFIKTTATKTGKTSIAPLTKQPGFTTAVLGANAAF